MTAKKTASKPAKKAAKTTAKTASVVDADIVSGPPSANPPGISNPALRALRAIGVTRVSQLTAHREEDVAALHGMGPKGVIALKAALKAQGKGFKR